MNSQWWRAAGLALVSTISANCLSAANAAEGKALQPTRLSSDYVEGKNLESLPPWPDSVVVRPLKGHRFVRWYTGPELTSMIYEADDGVIRLENLTYDEHVHLLKGNAILTSADGHVSMFKAGDSFTVPKGWNGTWEFKNGYREEITFYTVSLDEAMKSLFGK